jgi:hypothetical protein
MSFSASPGDALGWFEKIKEYFKDFRPEAKSMTINFSKKTSNIGLALKIEEGFRKNRNKIKIPAYPGFQITKMQDASFNQIQALWKIIDGEWILDAKDLPPSDGYFVELEGSIDGKNLEGLVHIKPSFNRDGNDEVDRYWLDASLREPKKLEEIWTELQIDEINVGVKVDINKLFGLKIPQELKDKADSLQKYLHAGRQGDRGLVFNALWDFKRQERKTPFHPNDFLRIIQNLTARETLTDYLSVDKSYNIGEIEHPTKYEGMIPQEVNVQALTTLTLKDPQSIGYLTLQKKLYLEKIKEEFDKVLKKKK